MESTSLIIKANWSVPVLAKVVVPPKFFSLAEDVQLSVLTHEAQHYIDLARGIDFLRNEKDGPIGIQTEQKTVLFAEEKIYWKEYYTKMAYGNTNIEKERSINFSLGQLEEQYYTYYPSNYYISEINAIRVQLECVFSDLEFRDNQLQSFKTMQWNLQRAEIYERENEYNKQGNKIKIP